MGVMWDKITRPFRKTEKVKIEKSIFNPELVKFSKNLGVCSVCRSKNLFAKYENPIGRWIENRIMCIGAEVLDKKINDYTVGPPRLNVICADCGATVRYMKCADDKQED